MITEARKQKNSSVGVNNYSWKGEKASYFAKHIWLVSWFGKANKCENKHCPKISKVFQWANISGKYFRSRDDYKMLCVSCHRLFDNNNKGNKCKRGHIFSKENTYYITLTKKTCRKCRALAQSKYIKEKHGNIYNKT